MGYTLDFFVAELRCPRCGNVSAADGATNMQTPSSRQATRSASSIPERAPPVTSIPNWAEIVVRDRRIESIAAVPLNRETLNRVHFITEDVYDIAADLAGRKYPDVAADEVVPLLRQLL